MHRKSNAEIFESLTEEQRRLVDDRTEATIAWMRVNGITGTVPIKMFGMTMYVTYNGTEPNFNPQSHIPVGSPPTLTDKLAELEESLRALPDWDRVNRKA